MTLRANTQNEMYFYNRQKFYFNYETDWGLRFNMGLQTESNRTAGQLHYYHLDGTESYRLRKSDVQIGIRWNPGVSYVNTKQQRIPVNLDSPELSLNHSMGLKGFLGGQFQSNVTTFSFYKRQWLGSWGNIDLHGTAKAQWNKVPFPLLIMPAANLSYIVQEETFNMINNMEFLNDRYASLDVSWDLNGKLLNRIPLLKKLKWREYIGVKTLWGKLTDKNNPTLLANAGDPVLWSFPEGSYVMDPKRPYVEVVAGLHNIFKILHVEYVHRCNYNPLPTAKKNGVRFMLRVTF